LASGARWREPECLLLVGLLAMSAMLALLHVRMHSYADWLCLPIIACVLADRARLWRRLLTPTVFVAIIASPTGVGLAGTMIGARFIHPADNTPPPASNSDPCYLAAAYSGLAREPSGLVLSEVDLGPYVIAYTPHSAMAGPYHRLRRGIVDTFHALARSPGDASAEIRSRHVAYVIDCPSHAAHIDHARAGAGSLQAALDKGAPPSWLAPISHAADPLQVYRVRP
jgi:hypothetical protein